MWLENSQQELSYHSSIFVFYYKIYYMNHFLKYFRIIVCSIFLVSCSFLFVNSLFAQESDCWFRAEGCIEAKPWWEDGILVKDGEGKEALQLIPDVVKSLVNWVLSILALIALIVVLWWWFQMLFSNGDDGKYQNGWKTLKNGALGLLYIGLAALILRLIFSIANRISVK